MGTHGRFDAETCETLAFAFLRWLFLSEFSKEWRGRLDSNRRPPKTKGTEQKIDGQNVHCSLLRQPLCLGEEVQGSGCTLSTLSWKLLGAVRLG